MKLKKRLLGIGIISLALITTACSGTGAGGAQGDEWKPTKPIEMIAPAGAGGGWDTTARVMQTVMEKEKLLDKSMAVVNKPGGGGAVGWSYIHKKKADPHTLFVTSPPIMFVPLNGQSEYGHQDFTPIAGVIADYGAFVVKKDAKWKDINELMDDLKKDPQSASIVGDSAPGSMDHMQFVKAANKAGVDVKKLKYVSMQDGGGMSQLLGGHVDVYSTGLAEATEQARAGKVRVLAITAEERLEGETISDFPTLKEQGIDDSFIVWRGIMGPPDMDPNAVKYYEQKIKAMLETEEWKAQADKLGWTENFMTSEEFGKHLDEEYKLFEELMKEAGLK
ncbi:Bug family tripartite tricarboxylate transporter substrate binding protein [Desmospora activa]|uniref:Putative tricarboxylic transport membrane protein n=1 Tax=Desmospora activa DSM 45169 TaxID=1121389 RepID=A0A2T4ZCY7_9BACL|nr:tripartite tricarboxylate transporter substrate binding protein [Desmospora activa]PTM59758.1 putative tricarboxylic transport membrane protein [Desmospora activa DSM 45169]